MYFSGRTNKHPTFDRTHSSILHDCKQPLMLASLAPTKYYSISKEIFRVPPSASLPLVPPLTPLFLCYHHDGVVMKFLSLHYFHIKRVAPLLGSSNYHPPSASKLYVYVDELQSSSSSSSSSLSSHTYEYIHVHSLSCA